MPAMPLRHGARIRLSACAKTFAGGTRALYPTDLEIERGEIVALLGPSGCGKTTMLRIMAGLETPDAGGAVLFEDEDVTATPIERRNVGMVFQSYALFPNMNVRANVEYGLKVRRMARAEIDARVDEVLALCRIEELAGREVDALSGGQRQRVALARAVAVRPRALLLDEPLSALDAALREHLREELAALLRTLSITAVFVTHDQAEAMTIADRIAVMRDGRIRQIGSPRELYNAPRDAFVATFVGNANPMTGTVKGGRLHLPGGSVSVPAGTVADALFFMRPEALTLCDPKRAALRGTVESCVFLGDRTRVVVSGVSDRPIAVTAPGHSEVRPGEVVGLVAEKGALIVVAPPREEVQ
jgi:putative spermidine/putrescine transport system ATP-binding protein